LSARTASTTSDRRPTVVGGIASTPPDEGPSGRASTPPWPCVGSTVGCPPNSYWGWRAG
jgi:hypothetical protein